MKTLNVLLLLLIFFGACKKQDEIDASLLSNKDSSFIQAKFIETVKVNLKDSLSLSHLNSIDFDRIYKSKDAASGGYFLRIGITYKPMASDFVILRTGKNGNIVTGKIVHVTNPPLGELIPEVSKVKFTLTSLNGEHTDYLYNTLGDTGIFMAPQSEPTTLPDCIVTGYIYNDYGSGNSWYLLSALAGVNVFGGGTYTYGTPSPEIHGGVGGGIHEDKTEDISYENIFDPTINLLAYLSCFSKLSNTGATFRITIFTDIPVNNNPNELFDYKTGACGHSFIQLYKSNGGVAIQQNIGFYPETGWKSIESNGPVASKLCDNAGHEFNASLTVTVDASHFQSALNEAQYYGKSKYDIDNFNCTDFALNVFNAAAPLLLSIPQYHIPGGMAGEVSNTPQGLYNELINLNKTGQYATYGQINIAGASGIAGGSHGACN